MYFSYVYHITCKVTNQFYYGSRFLNIKEKRTPEEDIWIYYFTSSKIVSSLIDLYGKDAFDIKIIFKYGNESSDDISYWYEQLLIREHIKNPLCLNQQYQDPDSAEHKFLSAGIISHWKNKKKETSPKKGKKFGKQTNSYSAKGKENPFKGKERPAQQGKKKIKNKKIICPHCNKEGGSAGMKHYHFDNCDLNPLRLENKYLKKLGSQNKLVCPYCNKTGGISNMKRYHFLKCKLYQE